MTAIPTRVRGAAAGVPWRLYRMHRRFHMRAARVRRRLVARGTEHEAVELSVGRGALKYTEYTRGGHDAWGRALRDERLLSWVVRGG